MLSQHKKKQTRKGTRLTRENKNNEAPGYEAA